MTEKTCSRCRQTLPTSFFDKASKERDGLQYYCKTCNRAVPLAAYRRNREILAALKQGGCVVCGVADIRVLDFDHIDPSTKTFGLSDLSTRRPQDILFEATKCRLLCGNCHRRHTVKQRSLNQFNFGQPAATVVATGIILVCAWCKKHKDSGEFHKNKTRPTGRTDRCRSCVSAYDCARRQEVRSFVNSHKKPCVDCGEPDLCVIEFDHVTGQKQMGLAQAKKIGPELVAELAKCVCVCVNCHRIRTATRRVIAPPSV